VLPWLVPVLGLTAVVLALWAKAAADRRPPTPGRPPATGTRQTDGGAGDSAGREG
jgi:hypothetical protein